MARIGTYSTYFEVGGGNTPNSYFDSRVYFTLDYEQNKTNGKTTYTLNVYAQRYSSGSDYASLSYNVHYVLAGEEGNRTGTWGSSGSGYTLTHLFTITKTVDSNQDGTGKQINFSAYGQTYNAYKYALIMYYTPPTVALQSTITSNTTDTSRKEFGEEVTFTINRSNNDYKHDIYYVIGDTKTQIGSNVDTSLTYTFPTELISSFINTDRPNITIECETKLNGSKIGVTTNTTVYLLVPDFVLPTIVLQLEDTGITPSDWGIWVKTRSKIKGTITADGSLGSIISSYNATANNENKSTQIFETNEISSSGNLTVTASVTDSRNKTVETSETIEVVDYFKPTISKFEVKRCNADGTLNENGGFARAYITYSISSCENNNAKTLKVRDESNDNEKTIPLNEYSGEVVSEVFSNISISEYYEFVATIEDTFEYIDYFYTVRPSKKVVSLRAEKDGVTLGQVATEPGFHCYYDADFHGKILQNGEEFKPGGGGGDTLPVGSIFNYEGTTVPSGYEIVANPDYSTTEHWTGRYWVDGKKLYECTIILPNGTGTTSEKKYYFVDFGISNINEIFVIHPSYYSNGDSTYPFAFYDGNRFTVRVDKLQLVLYLQYSPIANSKCVITVNYTKTTD